MKQMFTIAVALALACAPAMAVPFCNTTVSNNISVTLTIPCYADVNWQDSTIVFSSVLGTDYESTQITGLAYTATALKTADDPWAGHGAQAWAGGPYFESADGAFLWLASNCQVTMTVACSGDLTGTVTGKTIKTWYTLAASGPFFLGSVQLNDGIIPLDGPGSYAADVVPPALSMELPGGAANFWPNQYAFSMTVDTPETCLMAPSVNGNLKFLARILRNGLLDPQDTYNATITVTVANP